MLPISIVIKSAFKDFIHVFDPFFDIPNVASLKRKIKKLKKNMHEHIKLLLKKCPHLNISIDLWSDATMRSFVGYMVYGITYDWELVNYTLDFRQIKVRHTGDNIKEDYDNVILENG